MPFYIVEERNQRALVRLQIEHSVDSASPIRSQRKQEYCSFCSDPLGFHVGRQDMFSAAMFLRLLITWVCGSSLMVKSFVDNPANTPFLVDIVTSRQASMPNRRSFSPSACYCRLPRRASWEQLLQHVCADFPLSKTSCQLAGRERAQLL